MRDAILLSGLLTNSERWINITKKELDDLEKPDFTLQKKILSSTGNPSKCFTQLEIWILPVKYVVMKRSRVRVTICKIHDVDNITLLFGFQ